MFEETWNEVTTNQIWALVAQFVSKSSRNPIEAKPNNPQTNQNYVLVFNLIISNLL